VVETAGLAATPFIGAAIVGLSVLLTRVSGALEAKSRQAVQPAQ